MFMISKLFLGQYREVLKNIKPVQNSREDVVIQEHLKNFSSPWVIDNEVNILSWSWRVEISLVIDTIQ